MQRVEAMAFLHFPFEADGFATQNRTVDRHDWTLSTYPRTHNRDAGWR